MALDGTHSNNGDNSNNSPDPFEAPPPDPDIAARFARIEQEKRAQEQQQQASRTAQHSQASQGGAQTQPVADTSVKEHLKSIPMLDFYRQHFNPKAEKDIGQSRVLLSCFNTLFHGRGDLNPQFQINTDMNVYHCHACGVKGDMIDLLAVKYGLQDADNRVPSDAVDRAIEYAAQELLPGLTYRNVSGVLVFAQRDSPVNFPVFQMGSQNPQFLANNAPTNQEKLPESAQNTANTAFNLPPQEPIPTLDWKSALDPTGFCYKYMQIMSHDDSPEEFHLYNAFLALGLAAGRDLPLSDGRRPVRGNVFVCDISPAGTGKSAAANLITEVIRHALPYNPDVGSGVRLPIETGSGESLIDFAFRQRFVVPNTGGNGRPLVQYREKITALIEYGEFAALMNRVARKGATIETVLQDVFDCKPRIGAGSRTAGEVFAVEPYGSLITTSQPKRIASLMKKDQIDSGFASRLIYVMGNIKPPSGVDNDTLPPIEPLVAALKDISQWCQRTANTLHSIKWTAQTREKFNKFLHSVIEPTKEAENRADLFSRLDLMLKKHILWLCIDVKSPEVTPEILDRAFNYFWDYTYRCYRRVDGQLHTSDRSEREETVILAIKRAFKKKQQWPTASELRKNHLGKEWSREELDLLLLTLKKGNHITEMPPLPGRGNRQPRFSVADTEPDDE